MTVSADDVMIVNAARCLSNDVACFVGIGLPSTAANLARRLHAPDCVLIYESGCIGSKPTRLPLSIGDGELAETADAVVAVPEIFAYWLQAGRIDVGFLGAAQLDRFGNINSTVIGPYESPRTRLPGAAELPRSRRRPERSSSSSARTSGRSWSAATSSPPSGSGGDRATGSGSGCGAAGRRSSSRTSAS